MFRADFDAELARLRHEATQQAAQQAIASAHAQDEWQRETAALKASIITLQSSCKVGIHDNAYLSYCPV